MVLYHIHSLKQVQLIRRAAVRNDGNIVRRIMEVYDAYEET